jgi:hypothetical protein
MQNMQIGHSPAQNSVIFYSKRAARVVIRGSYKSYNSGTNKQMLHCTSQIISISADSQRGIHFLERIIIDLC